MKQGALLCWLFGHKYVTYYRGIRHCFRCGIELQNKRRYPPRKLTEKQEALYKAIVVYTSNEGKAPTILELTTHMGFRSQRSIQQYLEILERKGFIKRKQGRYIKRNIQLTSKKCV